MDLLDALPAAGPGLPAPVVPFALYGMTKNMNVMFMYALARRLRVTRHHRQRRASGCPVWDGPVSRDSGDDRRRRRAIRAARGSATDPATPDGLTWTELVTVTTAALRTGGCRGCSIGVYNTNLDPGGHAATRIVASVAAHARPG